MPENEVASDVAAWMRRAGNDAGGGGGRGGDKGADDVDGGSAAAADGEERKDSKFGELWFAGNLSYSTFNFQVGEAEEKKAGGKDGPKEKRREKRKMEREEKKRKEKKRREKRNRENLVVREGI